MGGPGSFLPEGDTPPRALLGVRGAAWSLPRQGAVSPSCRQAGTPAPQGSRGFGLASPVCLLGAWPGPGYGGSPLFTQRGRMNPLARRGNPRLGEVRPPVLSALKAALDFYGAGTSQMPSVCWAGPRSLGPQSIFRCSSICAVCGGVFRGWGFWFCRDGC